MDTRGFLKSVSVLSLIVMGAFASADGNSCRRSALEPVCVGDQAIFKFATQNHVDIAAMGEVTSVDLYSHTAKLRGLGAFVSYVHDADMRELYIKSGCTTYRDQKICVGDKLITAERDIIRNAYGFSAIPARVDSVIGINPNTDDVAILRTNAPVVQKMVLVQKDDLVIFGGCYQGLCVGDTFSAKVKVGSWSAPGYDYKPAQGTIVGLQGEGESIRYYFTAGQNTVDSLDVGRLQDVQISKYSDRYPVESRERGNIPVKARAVVDLRNQGHNLDLLLAMWAVGSEKTRSTDPKSDQLLDSSSEPNEAHLHGLKCVQTKNQSACSFANYKFEPENGARVDVKKQVKGERAKTLIKALLDHGVFNSGATNSEIEINIIELDCEQRTGPDVAGSSPDARAECRIDDQHLGYRGSVN